MTNVLTFIYHTLFILLGMYLVDRRANNWFAQLFWGLMGAITLLSHTASLVGMFQ